MIDSDDLAAGREWSTASLRIASDQLSVDAIGELLGLRPSSTRSSEGEPVFSVWVKESGLEPSAPLEDHVYILIEQLRDHGEALAELCRQATVEVWLSFSAADRRRRPSVVNHQALVELGALGIDLVLDPYPADRRAPRGD